MKKKLIISASRRTDIPAFYSEWFLNRIKAGYCTIINPFNSKQVSNVSLMPDEVELFVFWTRDPKPLISDLKRLDELGFYYMFLYTITGYPKLIEPFSPKLSRAVDTFKRLSEIIGSEKIIWRYDPVFFSNYTDINWHKNNFSQIARELSGFTNKVIVSSLELYSKTKRRLFQNLQSAFIIRTEDCCDFAANNYVHLFSELKLIAQKNNISIQSCCGNEYFSEAGIESKACIDSELVSDIIGHSVSKNKDKNQRKKCQCISSKDIGAHNTCLFGCKYCYATASDKSAKKNNALHSATASSFLGKHFEKNELIVNEQKDFFI